MIFIIQIKSKIFTEKPSSKINVSFIGAELCSGKFITFYSNNSKINKIGVLTNTGTLQNGSKNLTLNFVRQKQDILDSNTNTVFYCPRYDSYKVCIKIFKANKNVLLKNIMSLESELNEIIKSKKNLDDI